MVIETHTENIRIKDIKPGDNFKRGDMIFIRTNETDPDETIIVVDLETGEVHRYPPDDVVTPVEARIKTFS